MHHLLQSLFRLSFLTGSQKRRSKPLTIRWVLPNQLAVGRAMQKTDVRILADAKIHTIVSLCAESEATLPANIRQQFHCIRYALPDSHSSRMLSQSDVLAVLKLIHASITHHRPVYVHCLAGMERSPTICLAYLCLYHGYEIWESLTWLKQVNPRTMPTEEQLNVVRSLIATHSNFLRQLPSAVPPTASQPSPSAPKSLAVDY